MAAAAAAVTTKKRRRKKKRNCTAALVTSMHVPLRQSWICEKFTTGWKGWAKSVKIWGEIVHAKFPIGVNSHLDQLSLKGE